MKYRSKIEINVRKSTQGHPRMAGSRGAQESLEQYREWSRHALERVTKAGEGAAESLRVFNVMVGEYVACSANERRATARLMARYVFENAKLVAELSSERKTPAEDSSGDLSRPVANKM